MPLLSALRATVPPDYARVGRKLWGLPARDLPMRLDALMEPKSSNVGLQFPEGVTLEFGANGAFYSLGQETAQCCLRGAIERTSTGY
jgi:hypothetical protein